MYLYFAPLTADYNKRGIVGWGNTTCVFSIPNLCKNKEIWYVYK